VKVNAQMNFSRIEQHEEFLTGSGLGSYRNFLSAVQHNYMPIANLTGLTVSNHKVIVSEHNYRYSRRYNFIGESGITYGLGV
jgi:hypothetical protein